MQDYWKKYYEQLQPLIAKLLKERHIGRYCLGRRHYAAIAVCCLLLVVFSCSILIPTSISNANPEQVVITVTPGMTAGDIGALLQEKGIIRNVAVFRVIARIDGLENSLQAGEYSFTRGMSMQQIVDRLSSGETAYALLVIPEGYTVDQIAQLIEDKHIGSAAAFRELARNYYSEYSQPMPGVKYAAEGFLFPATYKVPKGMSEQDVFKQMIEGFNKNFTPEMRAVAQKRGLSVRQVIIMASLVEKEAQLPADRPLIAGVFFNRLQKAMPLQSCATIQYILGYPKPELSVQDTQLPSPYNTYLNSGMPPGPIANPGLEAIKAVLEPAATDYLYFVADRQGAHHFSVTYEEHLQNIKQVRE